MDLVDRIRDRYVPAARFPRGATVLVSGAPAFGVDFLDRAYGAFPWLVLAVLVVSYLLLLRAFRSVVLPAKAVVMNLLSVSATYGVLVLAFQHGWGEPFGLQQSPQIDGWIPIFLFAMLFGLSMDYEVFLLSRIREEWELPARQRARDRVRARAHRPHHHGRGDHHDRRVLRLPRRQLRRPAGVRPRARRRRSCSTRRSCARSSCRRR